MTISSESFISDVIIFLRNLLRDEIIDPITTRTSGFVMTSYPKRNTQFPLITIKQTNIETVHLGMQSEKHWVTFTMEIQVYARNSKEVDTLTQEIIEQLRTNQYGTESTDAEEIHGFEITSVVPIVEETGEQTTHRKVLSVEYKVIL